MRGSTHVLIGLSGVIAYGMNSGQLPGAEVFVAAAVGSLLPDIDHPQSALGSFFWWMPRPGALGHRKLTHTIWAVLALAWALWHFFGPQPWVAAMLWGVAGHIAADVLTNRGVPLLYPIKDRAFCIPLVTYDGLLEKGIAAALSLWIVIGGLSLLTGTCFLPAEFCPAKAFAATLLSRLP